jgi:hypothetical protein
LYVNLIESKPILINDPIYATVAGAPEVSGSIRS